jgi:hypothetical protein
VLRGGRRRRLSSVGPRAGAHAEAVTAALPGAAAWPAEAFRSAVFRGMRRCWVTEPEAIAAIRAGGARRERTAEDADAPLALADRRTGEGALPPGEGRGGPRPVSFP